MKLYSRIWIFGSVAFTLLLLAPFNANAKPLNYVGIGATDEGFAVNAKVELAQQLSLRPAVLTDVEFDDDTDVTIIAPVTYDFKSPFKNEKLLPFAGAGIGGTTRNDGDVGLAVTGGADYRASKKLTANGSIVWLPFDNDRVNVFVGLGYNF